MQISQTFSWPATNWPSTTAAATQYTVWQLYPDPATILATITTTSTLLCFDDTQNLVFVVRPTSGSGESLIAGPELAVFVVGTVLCRAWLRQKIRQALSDRTDSGTPVQTWPDDEINGYIDDAIIELNSNFPLESDCVIPLVPGQRDYPLPEDFFLVRTVEYCSQDGHMHLYLKEKPFRGGESTATSYAGYIKLGILLPPQSGRFYPGHFDIYERAIHLDWDALGNGDSLAIRYAARRPLPSSDTAILPVTLEDMNLLSLRTQMSCWIRVEGQDTRLSRFRGRDDGGRRDDMPTVRHSQTVKKMYNELMNDRRETRVKVRRLSRR